MITKANVLLQFIEQVKGKFQQWDKIGRGIYTTITSLPANQLFIKYE